MNTARPVSRNAAQGAALAPVIAGIALATIALVGVLPAEREIDKTRANIADLQADLQQQKALHPVYISLQQRRMQTLPDGIHVYPRQPLRIDDLAALPEVFEALSRASGVELVSATPQARSLRDGREMLRVDTRMRGDFLTFNTLLNRINEMPFIETIESLAIDVTDFGQEMRLSVWLAIQ